MSKPVGAAFVTLSSLHVTITLMAVTGGVGAPLGNMLRAPASAGGAGMSEVGAFGLEQSLTSQLSIALDLTIWGLRDRDADERAVQPSSAAAA